MGLSINTNIVSLNAQKNVSTTQDKLSQAIQRLSSGLRINSAKDDAAGLGISQRMSSQIRSLNQAVRNANDGVSMIQTAEGAMNEIQNMLQRMKELASQAANGTLGDTERSLINTEVQQLRDEMQDIASRTTFNGQSLLNGNLSTSNGGTGTMSNGFVLVAGTNTSATNIDVSAAKASTTYTFSYAAATDTLTLSDGTNSQSLVLSPIGADSSTTLNFSSLGVKVSVASVAGETADNIGAGFDTQTIITAAGSGSLNLQVGSGTTAGTDTVAVSFSDVRVENSANASISALKTALDAFNAGTASQAEASTLMSTVDAALDYFSSERSTLGALQNRMDYAVANTMTTVENTVAAKSRIVDADFASETANMTKASVLQQAGVAMLAQANALPQQILALLRG